MSPGFAAVGTASEPADQVRTVPRSWVTSPTMVRLPWVYFDPVLICDLEDGVAAAIARELCGLPWAAMTA
jgi:hypothetical protein